MTDQEKIELRQRLEGKSSDELREIIAADLADHLVSIIQVNLEVRMRLHECYFHGRANKETLEKMLDDSKGRLYELFKELLNAR